MEKVKFKDLSNWLKFGIIIGWFLGGYMVLSFIVGFLSGILGG